MKVRGSGKVARLVAADVDEQFLARLLHDLRNPLGVIAFFAEAIPDAADDERGEFCDRLRINADRALHILEEFALLADVRAGRLSAAADRVDLGAMIAELAAGLAAERGGARIECAGLEGLHMTGDAQHWQRALRALLREITRGASGDVTVDGARDADGLTVRFRVPLSVDRELGVSGKVDPTGLGIEAVHRLAQLQRGDLTMTQQAGLAVLTLTLPGI